MSVWRKRLSAAALGLAALVLAACGKGGAETLHIYNWSDYIDPAILTDFTKETGIKVVYDTFDSNEVLETKVLQGDTGYDLIVPSNHTIPRYVAAGAIQPLDKSKLAGLANLWPDIMAYMEPFDPGRSTPCPTCGAPSASATTRRPSPGACPGWPSTAGTLSSSPRTWPS
uniref:Extracellular solute-binding protein n=1 Tax=Phenylobacterium glaciei TaxID=2803784 RepID=A0A974S821_9CAUL|nr:extracellular solute-binding protein [Phenylobacterium glaciei]